MSARASLPADSVIHIGSTQAGKYLLGGWYQQEDIGGTPGRWIGSEPSDPSLDSMEHWRMVMRGHAAANMVPVVASNRIGQETTDGVSMTFYGSSFIAGPTGALAAEADRRSEGVLTATFDLDRCRSERTNWGTFRDRRPDLYAPLLSLDGQPRAAGQAKLPA